MAHPDMNKKIEIIKQVELAVKKGNKKSQPLCDLVKPYYQMISLEDLQETDQSNLAGTISSHFELALKRKPDQDLINIYSPDFETHGWESSNTIVDIVTLDRPFLVDSVSMALTRMNASIKLTIHPVVAVGRDKGHNIISLSPSDKASEDQQLESFMHFEVSRQTDKKTISAIKTLILDVINQVKIATADWQPMMNKMTDVIDHLSTAKMPFKKNQSGEVIDFCHWLLNNHFTFLGYCEFDLTKAGRVKYNSDSGLGLLRDDCKSVADKNKDILPSTHNGFVPDKELAFVSKANLRAVIHRPAFMDFIAINRYDAKGKVNGQICIIGLFTSAVYNSNPRNIPLLREKVDNVLKRSQLPAGSHDFNKLASIFSTYPRDSLFAISEEDLFNTSIGIMELQDRQRTRFFSRHDKYDRFYSCLVYVPKERYNRELRERVQAILQDCYSATNITFNTHFSESVHARIQFVVRIKPGTKPKFSESDIEDLIIEATHDWEDGLNECLLSHYEEEHALAYFEKYRKAFNISYKEDNDEPNTVLDIEYMETLSADHPLCIRAYRAEGGTADSLSMKLYSLNDPIPPSDSLPILENMGLHVSSEKPYKVSCANNVDVWIHAFTMNSKEGNSINIEKTSSIFEEGFISAWFNHSEVDKYNELILKSLLNWREVSAFRAYGKYLKQIGIRYSEDYMLECLLRYTDIVTSLADLFDYKFNPVFSDQQRKTKMRAESKKFAAMLDNVANIDDDRIIRGFNNLIETTLRTNFFQKGSDGQYKDNISFKLNSLDIIDLPLPRPKYEIFVYSPRVEAVHLRGGDVARGGLRWSDRREDFRTEVLGLVKAQLVKNAVIVPTGSKGGFIVKQPPIGGDRAAFLAEGIECYKLFIGAMLDITDNLIEEKIIPPVDVVRHDGDDPYLVVAADKGTATFSDIANALSLERGFWLGDAFASGGSDGYDHKKMGITARGAWESVKRHFRELGHDTQSQPFTVVGIGDMSGDVFGNGMLLSDQIKLVAGFNHLHIFIDPDPDPAKSYKERQRLFNLPRSGWNDYNEKLMSKGGGIFDRSSKSIKISPEMKALFDIEADSLSPTDLISALLQAPIDLMWNGGIGTYVKSSTETHEQVSDKANNGLRVNGSQLRFRVIGEGGNLGMTHLGRIEYCQHGGKCYTDFIDNSAGVDTSDHEVNIKILLNKLMEKGELSLKQRNSLLLSMTDNVADLVLSHNYAQTQAISLQVKQSKKLVREHNRFIKNLEKHHVINRKLEFLPTDDAIEARAQKGLGLTSPELATLLAYSKIFIYSNLLESQLPEDPYIRGFIENYFPAKLVKKYPTEVKNHQLSREIVATYVTNKMVNYIGPILAYDLHNTTGADYATIAQAFVCANEIFDIDTIWSKIEKLDNKVSADLQLQMLSDTAGLLQRMMLWLLRNRRAPFDIEKTISVFKDSIKNFKSSLDKTLASSNLALHKERKQYFQDKGVPGAVAEEVAAFVALSSSMDIIEVSNSSKQPLDKVAQHYFMIGEDLSLHWLRECIAMLEANNHWHLLAKSSMRNNLHRLQRMITNDVVSAKNAKSKNAYDQWKDQNQLAIARICTVIEDLRDSKNIDFAMLSVILGELQILRQGK